MKRCDVSLELPSDSKSCCGIVVDEFPKLVCHKIARVFIRLPDTVSKIPIARR